MISVKVVESVAKSLLLQHLLLVAGCHEKLSEIYPAGAVGIDQLQYLLDFVFSEAGVRVAVEDGNKFLLADNAVSISVHLFEHFEQVIFVLAGVELRSNIGVNHSFKFVFEMKSF